MRCELGKLGDLAPLSASLFGRGSQTGGAGRGGCGSPREIQGPRTSGLREADEVVVSDELAMCMGVRMVRQLARSSRVARSSGTGQFPLC